MQFGTLIISCLAVLAQTEPADLDRQQKKWNELYAEQAAKYWIALADQSHQQIQVRPESVLLWSNNVRRGDTNGSVFVWTLDGRPQVVGTVFSFLDRGNPNQRVIAHSFHSLSRSPLDIVLGDRLSWSIDVPGPLPQVIADAPTPAASAPLRLAQMRDLARQFSATTDEKNVSRELRLLPQPIYRQSARAGDVIDGGLFAFVTDSDPELLLLIEAQSQGDQRTWQYVPARFTDLTIQLRYKDVEVWSYERGKSPAEASSPYLSGRVSARSSHIE
jgi:hypothetical protein